MPWGVYDEGIEAICSGNLDMAAVVGLGSATVTLHTSGYTPSRTHTAASLTNEVADGNGYAAGGKALGDPTTDTIPGEGFVVRSDHLVWPGANFVARHAVLRSSQYLIGWMDFGMDVGPGADGALRVNFQRFTPFKIKRDSVGRTVYDNTLDDLGNGDFSAVGNWQVQLHGAGYEINPGHNLSDITHQVPNGNGYTTGGDDMDIDSAQMTDFINYAYFLVKGSSGSTWNHATFTWNSIVIRRDDRVIAAGPNMDSGGAILGPLSLADQRLVLSYLPSDIYLSVRKEGT